MLLVRTYLDKSAIHGLGCRSVLEFGAGWSSLVIAQALAAEGGGRLTTVEHERELLPRDAWSRVEGIQNVDVALVIAPLRLTLSSHGWLWSYRGVRRYFRERMPFDLVFIDGPPGEYGRTSPLFDAYPFLRPGAVIVLDDAARPGEQRAIKRWLATFPDLELLLLDTEVGRGIAVLVRHGGAHRRLALRAVLGTFRDQWRNWRKRGRRATERSSADERVFREHKPGGVVAQRWVVKIATGLTIVLCGLVWSWVVLNKQFPKK